MSLGAYDLAIIRLYREFEELMLECLVAAINHDPATFSNHKGYNLPETVSAEVCEYLICGDGYFDFKGRSGLIEEIGKIGPGGDWLLTIVEGTACSGALDKLSMLRNFAVHDTAVSRKRALKAIWQEDIKTGKIGKDLKGKHLPSSGAWIKEKSRLEDLCDSLKTMAREIEAAAPH